MRNWKDFPPFLLPASMRPVQERRSKFPDPSKVMNGFPLGFLQGEVGFEGLYFTMGSRRLVYLPIHEWWIFVVNDVAKYSISHGSYGF